VVLISGEPGIGKSRLTAAMRCRPEHRSDPVALPGAFQHRLGQFLDKERHPIGALNDLTDDLGGERRIAGQLVHQRLAVAFAEPIELEVCKGWVKAPSPERAATARLRRNRTSIS
jgi:hypothetical protein